MTGLVLLVVGNTAFAGEAGLGHLEGVYALSEQECSTLSQIGAGAEVEIPSAEIRPDRIIFAAGYSANICIARNVSGTSDHVIADLSCEDEQGQRSAPRLEIENRGEFLLLKEGKQAAVWYRCAARPDHAVMQDSGDTGDFGLAAVKAELDEAEAVEGVRPETTSVAADLNGDGRQEALITIFGGYFGGAKGCMTVVVTRENGDTRRLLEALTCSLTPMPSQTSGWKELSGDNAGIWSYDGQSYVWSRLQ